MTAVLAQVHEVIRAADDDLDIDPALAACLQLSFAGPLAGPRPAPDSPSAPPPMTLSAFGMNLHAATTADGRDRKQLERICRYLLRPPFAHDAVTVVRARRGAMRAARDRVQALVDQGTTRAREARRVSTLASVSVACPLVDLPRAGVSTGLAGWPATLTPCAEVLYHLVIALPCAATGHPAS